MAPEEALEARRSCRNTIAASGSSSIGEHKREALLHQIQRLMHERVMFGPIWAPATLHGVGPRVGQPAIGLSLQLYLAAPYEEIRLKRP